jgi:hypothetical protein
VGCGVVFLEGGTPAPPSFPSPPPPPPPPPPHARGCQAARSTVTGTPLVTMSKTAERC